MCNPRAFDMVFRGSPRRLTAKPTGQHGPATGWVGFVVNSGAGGSVTVAAICAPIG